MPIHQVHELDFANAILDNAGALVIVMDRAGRIVRFNRACEAVSGYTFAEIRGKFPWDTVLPPEIAGAVRTQVFEVLVSQMESHAGRYTNEWVHKSGQRTLIEWHNTVLRDADGRVNYVVALGIDVSEKHQAEQQLRQTSELLTAIVEHIPDMIFMKDTRELRFVLMNKAGEDLLGYSRANLIGKNDYDFFTREQADFFTAKDRDVLNRTGFLDIPEESIDTRNQGRRILHTKKIAIRDEHAAPRFLLGISEDITERKRAETALVESDARLREAQQLAKIGSWELDLVRNRLVWSDEIFRMFEVDKTRFDASYEAFLNAIHPDDRDAVNTAYTNSLRTRTPYSITHRLQTRDGTIKWVQEQCESFFDTDGKPLRSVGTVQDITERVAAVEALRRSEEQLRELNESLEQRVTERTRELEAAKNIAEHASKAKTDFLARMSHELRTPMNAILGFAQTLQLETLNTEVREQVDEIARAGNHLLELINELLDLSRIEAGNLVVTAVTTPLRTLIADTLKSVEPLCAYRTIALTNHYRGDHRVLVDATRFRQIMLNLLANAIKYNRTGGRIDLSCHVNADQRLRLNVTDTGLGIAPENMHRLFNPFERLGAERGSIGGTGIGLALSKRLAGLMGATMGAESVLGKGSTFWIEVPIAPPES